MQEYLVISAIGEDKPGIINGLSQAASECGCNILDTRMTVLGGEFALIMMISGQTDQISYQIMPTRFDGLQARICQFMYNFI